MHDGLCTRNISKQGRLTSLYPTRPLVVCASTYESLKTEPRNTAQSWCYVEAPKHGMHLSDALRETNKRSITSGPVASLRLLRVEGAMCGFR